MSDSPRARRLHLALSLASLAATLVPILATRFTPLLDYPNHLARAYVLAVPRKLDPSRSYPIVIVMHGDGGDGPTMQRAVPLESISGATNRATSAPIR